MSDAAGSGSAETTTATSETAELVRVTVFDGDDQVDFSVRRGRILRDVLQEHGLSPYTRLTKTLNCGGRGLCATCGVRLCDGPAPDHWHDRLADRFGYPRLSCQVTIESDLTVRLVRDKRIWGARE
jgi:ferredoxin